MPWGLVALQTVLNIGRLWYLTQTLISKHYKQDHKSLMFVFILYSFERFFFFLKTCLEKRLSRGTWIAIVKCDKFKNWGSKYSTLGMTCMKNINQKGSCAWTSISFGLLDGWRTIFKVSGESYRTYSPVLAEGPRALWDSAWEFRCRYGNH